MFVSVPENENDLNIVEKYFTQKLQKCLLLAHDVINFLFSMKI
jgi:hypothetical protein